MLQEHDFILAASVISYNQDNSPWRIFYTVGSEYGFYVIPCRSRT